MTLGVPAQVAREAGDRAVATATQVAALICLVAAIASVLAPGMFVTGGVRWWAAGSLLPMIAMLLVVASTRSNIAMIAYILLGCASTFIYTVALLEQTLSYTNTNLFVVALPLIALMLIGGSGADARVGVLWATGAYALGDVAVFAAAQVSGREFRFDSISLAVYVLFMLLLLFHGLTRASYRSAHAIMLRTMRQQRADELRQSVAAELRAELHDTALSELAAVAAAEPGPLPPGFRDRIEADIRHWLLAPEPAGTALIPADEPAWLASDLSRAIDEVRDSGLVIEISGDRSPYLMLRPDARRALALAARQCLVNVAKHSGQSHAEILLSASDREVSLVVVDSGRGFDAHGVLAAGGDRMGLAHSVIDRVERVGGSVTVFSKPGAGTSVLMVVPSGSEA